MEKAIEQSPTLPQRGSEACAGVFGSNAQVCDTITTLAKFTT